MSYLRITLLKILGLNHVIDYLVTDYTIKLVGDDLNKELRTVMEEKRAYYFKKLQSLKD